MLWNWVLVLTICPYCVLRNICCFFQLSADACTVSFIVDCEIRDEVKSQAEHGGTFFSMVECCLSLKSWVQELHQRTKLPLSLIIIATSHHLNDPNDKLISVCQHITIHLKNIWIIHICHLHPIQSFHMFSYSNIHSRGLRIRLPLQHFHLGPTLGTPSKIQPPENPDRPLRKRKASYASCYRTMDGTGAWMFLCFFCWFPTLSGEGC